MSVMHLINQPIYITPMSIVVVCSCGWETSWKYNNQDDSLDLVGYEDDLRQEWVEHVRHEAKKRRMT